MSFKGKNDTKNLKFLFQERARYYAQAFDQGGVRRTGVTDVNSFETVFYGKSDFKLNSMFPKQELIKSGAEVGTRNLNYVVDAFEGFRRSFHQHLVSGNGDINYDMQHPFLSRIKVYRSYESPEIKYQAYVGKLVSDMQKELEELRLTNNITDFSDFVNYFVEFLSKKGSTFPLTRTGFQKSTRSNIFTTGMAFSISNLDCGDDVQKTELFSEGPNLDLYLTIAQNWGFTVSLICPWIMIANPIKGNSTFMTEKLEENNIRNVGNVFDLTHDTLYQDDITNLINILRLNYNLFIRNNPVQSSITFNGRRTRKSRFFRTQIDLDDLNSVFPQQQQMILYATIRNIEENNALTQADFDRLQQNSTFLLNKFDINEALSYINDTFRNTYVLKPGGLNNYLRRKAEAQQNSEE